MIFYDKIVFENRCYVGEWEKPTLSHYCGAAICTTAERYDSIKKYIQRRFYGEKH